VGFDGIQSLPLAIFKNAMGRFRFRDLPLPFKGRRRGDISAVESAFLSSDSLDSAAMASSIVRSCQRSSPMVALNKILRLLPRPLLLKPLAGTEALRNGRALISGLLGEILGNFVHSRRKAQPTQEYFSRVGLV
jgi:hypothetical protein